MSFIGGEENQYLQVGFFLVLLLFFFLGLRAISYLELYVFGSNFLELTVFHLSRLGYVFRCVIF